MSYDDGPGLTVTPLTADRWAHLVGGTFDEARFRALYDVDPANVRVIRLVSGVDQPPHGWHVIRRRPLSTLCGYLVGQDGTVRTQLTAAPVGTIRLHATFDLVDDLPAVRPDMCPTCYPRLVADPDVEALLANELAR
jgi:hypothetical protein